MRTERHEHSCDLCGELFMTGKVKPDHSECPDNCAPCYTEIVEKVLTETFKEIFNIDL